MAAANALMVITVMVVMLLMLPVLIVGMMRMWIPEEIARKLAKHDQIPATLIARLAAGDLLLADALRRCLHVSKQDASWAVIVMLKVRLVLRCTKGARRLISIPDSISSRGPMGSRAS
jgi:hypothetical protein